MTCTLERCSALLAHTMFKWLCGVQVQIWMLGSMFELQAESQVSPGLSVTCVLQAVMPAFCRGMLAYFVYICLHDMLSLLLTASHAY